MEEDVRPLDISILGQGCAGQEEGLQKDQLGYTYVEPDDYKHLWLDNDKFVVSNLASFSKVVFTSDFLG